MNQQDVFSMGFIFLCVIGLLVVMYLRNPSYVQAIIGFFSLHRGRPYRNLSSNEQETLIAYLDSPHRNVKIYNTDSFKTIRYHFLGVLFYICTFGGLFLQIFVVNIWQAQLALVSLPILIIILLIVTGIYDWIMSKFKKNEIPDIQEPVYLIQGRIFLNHHMNESGKEFDYAVSRYHFFVDNTVAKYRDIAQSLQESDSVTIEYSPMTHYVWRIEIMLNKKYN